MEKTFGGLTGGGFDFPVEIDVEDVDALLRPDTLLEEVADAEEDLDELGCGLADLEEVM